MNAESPQILGIAGGSCAGKTWLADRLEAALDGQAARLSLDDFYMDRSHLPMGRRALVNFDHPRAIDWDRFESVLERFAKGVSAEVPCYDFATHGRRQSDSILNPRPILIVDGLWLFRTARLRSRFSLKIFIGGNQQWRTERRVARDTAERGRTRAEVLAQLERYTAPSFERFVAPQEEWADVVLTAPITETDVNQLIQRIATQHSSLIVGI